MHREKLLLNTQHKSLQTYFFDAIRTKFIRNATNSLSSTHLNKIILENLQESTKKKKGDENNVEILDWIFERQHITHN